MNGMSTTNVIANTNANPSKSTNGTGTTSTTTAVGDNTYTNLHLSAITLLHPPSPPRIKQCPCEAHAALEQGHDQNKLIHV
jgi:hypothetical protein